MATAVPDYFQNQSRYLACIEHVHGVSGLTVALLTTLDTTIQAFRPLPLRTTWVLSRAYILLRRRGHATPHMPVETAKCWWLLKIKPNAWAGGKGSCAVCIDLQAVGALEFFGELYSLAKGFGPFLRGVWAGFREREGSIFSNHQHFAVSTGICGVAYPLLRRSI